MEWILACILPLLWIIFDPFIWLFYFIRGAWTLAFQDPPEVIEDDLTPPTPFN